MFVTEADIAGFAKVTNAMLAQGIVQGRPGYSPRKGPKRRLLQQAPFLLCNVRDGVTIGRDGKGRGH